MVFSVEYLGWWRSGGIAWIRMARNATVLVCTHVGGSDGGGDIVRA
jgi:hypothetical protein